MTFLKELTMRRAAIGMMAVWGLLASTAMAGEVGFIEDFSLAKDRSAPLKQLIPGTEDYYYYNCLHAQNQGKLADVDEMLKAWIKRYDRTQRVVEIENRQALLKYEKDPKGSLEYIRQRLGLQFNHQRELLGQKPQLPTSLDQKLISRETLTQVALQRHPGSLQGFEERAHDWLVGMNLAPDRRRHLLSRLKRPDYPNLPRLVVDDLNHENSGGFGSHEIHRHLLLAQLEECLKLKPDLLNQVNFVNTYLTKLWPSPDADWQDDEKEREAYLDRLWAFASKLNPSHNSLKAHVLYHRLVHDRQKGVYDSDRFTAYIQLPRNVNYISPKYMEDAERRRWTADINANYQQFTLLPPVGNDEPLVRSYLMNFFVKADSIKPYDTYIHDDYLKHCFAETKIVNGLGDMEQWYSMLPPPVYQALKERVDLDFDYTNKTLYGVDDPVALDIHVKNVKTLIVKVYQLNAFNYYRANGREVDTGINLDGLVANDEKTYTYDEPALRRVKRHFEFAALKGRGTYIIELIGSGRSSRAVVRRGRLQYLVRTGTAGHVFTVLDEANRKVSDAALWLAGHKYTPDKDGYIAVPFSNQPGRQPIILAQGEFACLDQFQHEPEQYRLAAGIYVDREALLKRKKASVIVRPMLCLNGTPVTLSVLEEPTLLITSVDREGVSTTKEAKDFKLFEDRESVYEFQVPANLARISFTLKAKVQNLSQNNKKEDLADSEAFSLNAIDATEKIEDLLLRHVEGQYVLDVLGKSGEAKADRPVNLALKHRDFTDPVNTSVQSDARGRIALGALADVDRFTATGPEGVPKSWSLGKDVHSYPRNVHGRVGAMVLVPYMAAGAKPARSEVSFLERRGGTFLKDCFESLSVKNGFLQIQDLAPGDYDLLLKDSNERVTVRLTAGAEAEGYVLAKNRHLEVQNAKPLQIAAVEADKETVRVRLENASKFARVHVMASRYMPEYSAYGSLRAAFPEPYLVAVPKTESLYVIGRDIGEEYRYILERRYARKYAGNMLTRPSLLLNPWAIRKTETSTQEAREGEEFERLQGRPATGMTRGTYAGRRGPAEGEGAFFSNLDFLGEGAAVLANLRPDEKGVVAIKRADLGAHQQIRVVAVDPQNTVYREVALPDAEMKFEDLRLVDGLDPQKHFTEQKQVSVVKKGAEFALSDITTSEFECYDSLDKVYTLYVTLSNNPTLVEFGFLLGWPKLKPEEKRELYAKYACHELHFFLFRKDPDFFKAVVLPYLKNKKDKTFLDHWFLGDDLSGYLKPWAYGQLNVVERILLAQSLKGDQPNTSRHVKDTFDLIPPDVERFNHLFRTALKASALETRDRFGLEKAKGDAMVRKLEESQKDLKQLRPRAEAGELAEAAKEAPAESKPAAAPSPAPGRPAPPAKKAAEPGADRDMAKSEELADKAVPADGFFAREAEKRRAVRQFYRKLDKTEEYVENNYYHLPIEAQNAGLVTVNAFWNDYAAFDGKGDFYSMHLAEASRSFTEMMFALAVLDLPSAAAEHKTDVKGARFALTAGSPMVAFHKEIKEAAQDPEKTSILVSQNFYRHGERYRQVGNEQLDKFVSDEFLTHVVYGCHVVITNPTSSRQKLDVLLQVPRGAIPVLNGLYTRSTHVDLEPYRTQTFDYFFYFPAAGQCKHYPVHVAKNEKLIASAAPVTLNVVEKPTKIDTASWDYISQHGTEDQVIAYIQANNLGRTNLERIAWRMQEPAFFRKTLALLDQRHTYHHTLWSYGIKHDELPATREFLQHSSDFLAQCGAYIDCRLVTIDPVVRKSYQHMEYWPLVNARAHQLGKTRKILNDRFYGQYMRFLTVLSYRPKLDDDDLMSTVYYLLLQDRVEDGLGFFAQVDAKKLATALQHDYFDAYLDFYSDAPKRARAIATKYAEYPVDRWRNLFANVAAQLDELEGKEAKVVDKDDKAQQQAKLAATEGAFEFKVEAKKITLTYQNLSECLVNYYLMDVELLFSRNPFVQGQTGQFAFIRPNETAAVKLDPAKTTHTFDLPEKFHSSNVMVEIIAGGAAKAQAYYSNALALQVVENYGQAKITHEQTGKPLPKVYVKVYARMKDGQVKFYKDGYTDLRGRFDYASLNTNEIDIVDRFSMLVLSETDGAVVREAAPPKR
jgi:hypothetical protein